MTLFTYIDYRQFLKDYFVQQKKSHPNFSYEYFARRSYFCLPVPLTKVGLGLRGRQLIMMS